MKYIFYLILLFFNLGFLRADSDITNTGENNGIDTGDNNDTTNIGNSNDIVDTGDNNSTGDNNGITNTDDNNSTGDNNDITNTGDESNAPIKENKERIRINGIAYIYDIKIDVFNNLKNAYNRYSIENNLGIDLNIELFTPSNTTEYKDFGFFLESIFYKNNGKKKYDIVFYYDTYTPILGHHFVELEKYIDSSRIDMYERSIIDGSCVYNNKVIGLPVFFDTNVLYSNMILLGKYGKDIPKTWDQLIETAAYIRDQEREQGNTDFDPFLGIFSPNVEGALSLFEVTTSCRESNKDPFPNETTETFREGIQVLKKIKENLLNSPELFESNMEYTVTRFYQGKALFVKFYMGSYIHEIYKPSVVPGKKEGVTGTIPAAFSVSLNRYIADDEERRNAALNVIDFFTSKETQRDYILKNNVLSAMTRLYYDEEVCSVFECDVFTNSKPFVTLNIKNTEIGEDKFIYLEKVRINVFDYVYGKITLNKAMKNILDITKIYDFSLNTDDSSWGVILFVLYFVLLGIMLIAVAVISFITRKKSKCFLSYDFWILSILGTIVMMSSMVSLYGTLNPFKCQLKISLASIGLSMTLFPIINKLIVNFPTHNNVSLWFDRVINKYIFFISSVLVVGLANVLLFAGQYSVKTIMVNNGQNFQTCIMNSRFGNFVLALIAILMICILLTIAFLVFVEWNYKETLVEIKVIATLLFDDAFAIIMLFIYGAFNFKSYLIYAVLFGAMALFFSFSSFVFICTLKLILLFEDPEGEESVEAMMKKMHESKGVFSNKASKSSIIKTGQVISESSSQNFVTGSPSLNIITSPSLNIGACVNLDICTTSPTRENFVTSPIGANPPPIHENSSNHLHRNESTNYIEESTKSQTIKSQSSVAVSASTKRRSTINMEKRNVNKFIKYHYKETKD